MIEVFAMLLTSVCSLAGTCAVEEEGFSIKALVVVDTPAIDPSLKFPTMAALGSAIFVDTNLSLSRGQSCASCHSSNRAFSDPRHNGRNFAARVGVSMGDDHFSLGTRNAPTAAYASFSPVFSEVNGEFQGGQFWDGRAPTLEVQAGGPFINPVEMQMPNEAAVVVRVKENPDYVASFEALYGEEIFDSDQSAYRALTEVLASFEREPLFHPFDSKWDEALAGNAILNDKEQRGLELFESMGCDQCHTSGGALSSPNQTFTDYRFYNLGLPKNNALIAENESRGLNLDFVANGDRGLAQHLPGEPAENLGKFKTPTLRNVGITYPYMHNGVFTDLKTTLTFLLSGGRANDTPFAATVSPILVDQNASATDVEALECFLRALTDSAYVTQLPTMHSDGTAILCD